jgi:hypothetical protein
MTVVKTEIINGLTRCVLVRISFFTLDGFVHHRGQVRYAGNKFIILVWAAKITKAGIPKFARGKSMDIWLCPAQITAAFQLEDRLQILQL